jgi:hypothetical protein
MKRQPNRATLGDALPAELRAALLRRATPPAVVEVVTAPSSPRQAPPPPDPPQQPRQPQQPLKRPPVTARSPMRVQTEPPKGKQAKRKRISNYPPLAKERIERAIQVLHLDLRSRPQKKFKRANPASERADLVRFIDMLGPASLDPPEPIGSICNLDAHQAAELSHRSIEGQALTFPVSALGAGNVRLVMGLDFGTSCTKIVVRAPDMTQFKAVAVPALPFAQADGHPFLWASYVWVDHQGTFYLDPAPGRQRLGGIKAGLMGVRAASLALGAAEGRAITPLHAATAFLALMIRQARGWIYLHLRDRFARGTIQWSLNLGFPAATLDRGMGVHYATALRAAWLLAGNSQPVTLARCDAALVSAKGDALPPGLHRAAVVPEIVAAMNGFVQSYAREEGIFALVDVGATTLDVCTFTLFSDRDGTDRISIWLADVERFGVRPWHACHPLPARRDAFVSQSTRIVLDLLWKTRRKRDPHNSAWKAGGELRVFCTGGGIADPMYSKILGDLDPWLRRVIAGSKGVRLRSLDTFADVDLGAAAGADPGRLLVGAGLSHPDLDFPTVITSAEIEDIDTPMAVKMGVAYVDKDHV